MHITITRPDDWHLHVRDGALLPIVLGHSARHFARAIIMPNLQPPITTTEQALAYHERILAACPADTDFTPLMTLYLTDSTEPAEIMQAKASGHVLACKLYPAGATTHSDAGVTAIERIYPALEAMQEQGLPLLVHGEVTDPDVDIFDREAVFIERILQPLVQRFAGLKIVLEHITTQNAVDYINAAPDRVAATITAHHLLYNRNALFKGGIRPHYYCLPILKHERHRQALVAAATSSSPKFFLGTDSAPHLRQNKEAECGCAGCYTAFSALALYAEVFEHAQALDKLEDFASHFGADFYGLPRNSSTMTLRHRSNPVPLTIATPEGALVPLRAGEILRWQVDRSG